MTHYPDGKPLPCQTFYVKYGVAKQIAWAKNTKGVCESVAAQVQENLEQAGFRCSPQEEDVMGAATG